MEGNSFLSSHKTGSNGLHKLTAQTFKKRIQPNIQICSITLLENLTFPNANASQVPFIQRWEASFKIMSQFCEFRWVCFNNKYAQCEGNQNLPWGWTVLKSGWWWWCFYQGCVCLSVQKNLDISSFVVGLLGSLMGGSDQMMIRINMLMGWKWWKIKIDDDECNLRWGLAAGPQIRGNRLNPLPQFQCHLIATNLGLGKPAKCKNNERNVKLYWTHSANLNFAIQGRGKRRQGQGVKRGKKGGKGRKVS